MTPFENPNASSDPFGAPEPARRVGPYEASLRESQARAELINHERRSRKRRHVAVIAGAASAVIAVSIAVGLHFLRPQPTDDGAAGVAPVAQTTNVAAPGCKKPTSLTVNVPDSISTTFTSLVRAFQTQPGVPCASFTIIPKPASVVAQSIAGPDRPDAWVIDSALWLTQANHRAGLGLAADAPFAISPIVVAMRSQSADEAAKWGWKELAAADAKLVLPDPTASTVGLFSLVAAGSHWSSTQFGAAAAATRTFTGKGSLLQVVSDPEQHAMTPVTAAELAAYNAANPSAPLSAVDPADGAPALEYSLVSVADGTLATRVLKSLRDFVATDEAGDIVTRSGFALPGAKSGAAASSGPAVKGTAKAVPAPSDKAVAAARQEWAIFAPPPQGIVALDVSSTSLSRISGVTVLELMRQATQASLAELPDNSKIALWAFAQHLGANSQDYKALAASGELNAPNQVQAIAQALGSLKSIAGGGRGLYDTIVAAQAAARAAAAPGRANTAIIVTSGANDDDFGLSLGEAKAAVARGADPAHNLRLVIIGVGPKADAANLSAIAKSAGGSYVAVATAEELQQALQKALATQS